MVRRMESVHNVHTKEEAKKRWHDNNRGLGGTPPWMILFSDTSSYGAKKPIVQRVCQNHCKTVCRGESALAPWRAARFHYFHEDGGPKVPTNQLEKCDEISGGKGR